MTDKCRTCRFWSLDEKTADQNDDDWGFGSCRYDPPAVMGAVAVKFLPAAEWNNPVEPEIHTTDLSIASRFPVTFATDWCGRFDAGKAGVTPYSGSPC